MNKENRAQHFFYQPAQNSKHEAYAMAQKYWTNKDTQNAEAWAVKAMERGSQTLAPQLLAEIADKTGSKHTAITLASYYFRERNNLEQALFWARKAQQFGSEHLAINLINEITARQEALSVQDEVWQPSSLPVKK